MPVVFVNLLHYTGQKGGMETYARELYRELGRQGGRFDFVGYASREIQDMNTSWFPGPIVDSGRSGENRFAWAYGELVGVSREAARRKADLIHGTSLFAPLRSRVPVVVTIHDMLYFSNPELMSTPLYTEPVKWMERRGARTATRVITISEVSARQITRYLGVARESIDLIPLAGTPRASALPQLPRAERHLLAVGQRRPHKNFERLLEGLARIPADRRPRLTITGSYGDDPLKPVVARLGLADHVELRDWIERAELERLFATATALVDASLVTGFSLPTLEAMLDGLPVLLADTEIFREVGGDAARYFDPLDPDAIGDAMLALVDDAELRVRMSERGLARAAEYSWSSVAAATLHSFERTLADAGRR